MAIDPSLDLSDPDVRKMLLDQRRAARKGAKYGTPPSIPEVAKAYQNDPRTQLAAQAMAGGSSTAPTATGGYGIPDGIARALTGVAGGFINKQQQQKFGPLQEDTLDRTDIQAAAEQQAKNKAAAAAAAVTAATAAPAAPAVPAAPAAPPSTVLGQSVAPLAPPPTFGGPALPPGSSPAVPAIASALQAPSGGPQPSTVPSGPTVPPIPTVGGTARPNRPFSASASLGGGPNLSAGRDALTSLGITISSGYRTPKHNAEVGGVTNSFHTRGTPDNPLAYDFQPGTSGLSLAGVATQARKAFPGYDVITEPDTHHVHVEPSDAMVKAGVAPGPGTAAPAPVALNAFAPPTDEAIPELPKPLDRPKRPDAIGPQRSELLQAAYNIMRDRDPFQYAQGKELYASGLSEQDKMNEAAAARQQALIDAEYGTDRSMFATSQGKAEEAQYGDRTATIAENRKRADAYLTYQREVQQKELDRQNELERARIAAAAAVAKANKPRPIPQKIKSGYASNQAAVGMIDKAIAAITANPNALGLKNIVGDTVTQRLDPNGVAVRAIVANIGSQKRHDRSGAAVTVGENPYLKPFIPTSTDRADAAIKKLQGLKQEYLNSNSEIETGFSGDDGYEPIGGSTDVPKRLPGETTVQYQKRTGL